VTKNERIAHLEALLERIRVRAAEPRQRAVMNGHAADPAALAVIAAPEVAAPAEAVPAFVAITAPVVSAPAIPPASPSRDEFSFDSSPPPPEADVDVDAPPLTLPRPPREPTLDPIQAADADYEVRESRARLVSDSRADEFYDHDDDGDLEAAIPQRHDTLPPEADADAVASPSRPAPPSSRRPIAIEQQMSALEGEGSPMPPPPESGRQVAEEDDPNDFDGEFTGVRHASSFTQRSESLEATLPSSILPGESIDIAVFGGPPPSAPLSTEARAVEVFYPRFPPHADLAAVFTAAPRFLPTTFTELLEATLAL